MSVKLNLIIVIQMRVTQPSIPWHPLQGDTWIQVDGSWDFEAVLEWLEARWPNWVKRTQMVGGVVQSPIMSLKTNSNKLLWRWPASCKLHRV